MIARAGSGWQTVLADLSLILFMVTAAAVEDQSQHPTALMARTPGKPGTTLAAPTAVWRPGEVTLAEWLARQQPDPRARITVVLRPGPHSWPEAVAAVQQQLGRAVDRTRLIVDPSPGPATEAWLGYDRTDPNPAPLDL